MNIKLLYLLWVNASCCVVTMNKYNNPYEQRIVVLIHKITSPLFMRLVILHHLLNVFVELANKRGFKKQKKKQKKIFLASMFPR
jgi:hypothetical protein